LEPWGRTAGVINVEIELELSSSCYASNVTDTNPCISICGRKVFIQIRIPEWIS
jgi:hypothetical protein